jgi:CRP/FNR family transcriptional regulator, anaerobic regulatory protein
MQTDLLFYVMNNIRPLSGALKEQISSCVVEEHFPKSKLIVRNGRVTYRIWFMVEGFGRAYRYDDEKQQTLWFTLKGGFFTADHSFFRQHPSEMNILIHKGSTLLSMSFDDVLALRQQSPEFQQIYSALLEKHLLREQETSWSRVYDKPAVRLEKLLSDHPLILTKVNQSSIASYLGISKRTLTTLLSNR